MDNNGKGIRELAGEIDKLLDKKDMTDLAMIWWCVSHQRNKTRFDQSALLRRNDLQRSIIEQLRNWKLEKELEVGKRMDKLEKSSKTKGGEEKKEKIVR